MSYVSAVQMSGVATVKADTIQATVVGHLQLIQEHP